MFQIRRPQTHQLFVDGLKQPHVPRHPVGRLLTALSISLSIEAGRRSETVTVPFL